MDFESRTLSSIAEHQPKVMDEVLQKLAEGKLPVRKDLPEAVCEQLESFGGRGAARPETFGGRSRFGDVRESMASRHTEMHARSIAEAIVLTIVRPPLMIFDGTYVSPKPSETIEEVLKVIEAFDRTKIDPAIKITGRVEFGNVPGVPYVGTGWIVEKPADEKAIVITNRHVAEEFARPDGRGGYDLKLLPNYREYQVSLDLLEEYGNDLESRVTLSRVRFISGPRAPDIALIEVTGDAVRALKPLEFQDAPVEVGQQIGVVGYPAYDSRSDRDDVVAYFGQIFNKKRFAFGNVTTVSKDIPEFTHDATTLGGNSGSIIHNRDTGEVVGLHFAGEYKIGNYAVPVSEIKAALAGLTSRSVVPSAAVTEAAGDGRSPIASFKGRDGYQPKFLGVSVDPPKPGETWSEDLADVIDADTGGKTKELKYRHFSVWMCKSRKLPLLTAVNIDGTKAKKVGRIDKWFIDGRLADEFQVDNEAYLKNPLDRGHMVRREDPVWDDDIEVAREANRDTFHYANAAPQHEDLNQKDWVNLEDYILGNARTRELKVSVFTGPVFGVDDPKYRDVVRLPNAFWKIAAIVNNQNGELSVTAYLLGQGNLIKNLTTEFVYGPFRTYQVEVAKIGELARLDVDHLIEHDPFTRLRRNEGRAGTDGAFATINGSVDLTL